MLRCSIVLVCDCSVMSESISYSMNSTIDLSWVTGLVESQWNRSDVAAHKASIFMKDKCLQLTSSDWHSDCPLLSYSCCKCFCLEPTWTKKGRGWTDQNVLFHNLQHSLSMPSLLEQKSSNVSKQQPPCSSRESLVLPLSSWKARAVSVARVNVECADAACCGPRIFIPHKVARPSVPQVEAGPTFISDFEEQITQCAPLISLKDKRTIKWTFPVHASTFFMSVFLSQLLIVYFCVWGNIREKNPLILREIWSLNPFLICRVPGSVCCSLGCGTGDSGWCKVSRKKREGEPWSFIRLQLPAWSSHLRWFLAASPFRGVVWEITLMWWYISSKLSIPEVTEQKDIQTRLGCSNSTLMKSI